MSAVVKAPSARKQLLIVMCACFLQSTIVPVLAAAGLYESVLYYYIFAVATDEGEVTAALGSTSSLLNMLNMTMLASELVRHSMQITWPYWSLNYTVNLTPKSESIKNKNLYKEELY